MKYIPRELERQVAVQLVECKTTGTPAPAMAAPMLRLATALREKRGASAKVEMTLVHQRAKAPIATRALAPGVEAIDWREFVGNL